MGDAGGMGGVVWAGDVGGDRAAGGLLSGTEGAGETVIASPVGEGLTEFGGNFLAFTFFEELGSLGGLELFAEFVDFLVFGPGGFEAGLGAEIGVLEGELWGFTRSKARARSEATGVSVTIANSQPASNFLQTTFACTYTSLRVSQSASSSRRPSFLTF